jgi:hypothetical protein
MPAILAINIWKFKIFLLALGLKTDPVQTGLIGDHARHELIQTQRAALSNF